MKRIRRLARRLRGGTKIRPRPQHLGDAATRYDDSYQRRAETVDQTEPLG